MAEGKKISFGFSKISKKPAVIVPRKEENEIQFIQCLEENSIKLVNGEEKEKEALVIPLKNGNLLRDNMIEALKARKEENSTKNSPINEKEKSEKADPKRDVTENESEKKPLTLDELAAKEILDDLKKSNESEDTKDIREIPATNSSILGEKESTIEDYENVPINEFGLAMLRGMGWAPDKGIGKNGQVIQPVNPVVRPKGMGLGADKVMPTTVKSKSGEELVLKKTASLKIISGPHKNLYGRVEGFDELPGRIMVRLALQNTVISISENLVQLVTSEEYNKNSKILNLNDYNKYYEQNESKKNVKASIKTELSDSKPTNRREQLRNSDDDSENPSRKGYSIKRSENIKRDIKKRAKSSSSSPERSKKYEKYSNEQVKRKTFSNKNRETSSDSEQEHYKEKRSDHTKHNIVKTSKERRRHSPSPDNRYQRHKSTRNKRSPSSSSEYDYKISKSRKTKSRNRSSSSDSKIQNASGKSRSHSFHSKKKGKHKSRRESTSSSDSENEKPTKNMKHDSKKHVNSKKQRRKGRDQTSDSDSDVKESKQRTHKNYSRQRSTSRSPTRKKKKKHHKSRS